MTYLAEDLCKLGHEVTVITSKPHYSKDGTSQEYRALLRKIDMSGALTIYRLGVYAPRSKSGLVGRAMNYFSWNALSLVAGALIKKSDLLFIPSPPLTNGLIGYFLSRMRHIPFIYNVQDIYPDIAVRLGILKNTRMIKALRTLEKFVYERARAVTVISEGFKKNLLKKWVPDIKIKVIPNFVDTEFIKPLPRENEFSRSQGLNDRFVILFAGNIGLSQGLEKVLETAELLQDKPEIFFLFVGSGASREQLQSLACQKALDNVRFIDFQPFRRVPEVYASADVCLVPLKRGITEESVPSKVYSILSAGRPLIASLDEGSETWNLVKRIDCGLCVPPESPEDLRQAIMSFFRDRSLGSSMGARGRRYVEEYHSRYRIAEEYEKLFLSVGGKKG